jgi:lambda repressor-like predicted transcriptional regulator
VLVTSDTAASVIADLRGCGWTQARIARAAGLSASTISKAAEPGVVIDADVAASIESLRVGCRG